MRGVNLVGYLKAESGVGQVGRSLARVLEAARIPYSVHFFDQTRSRQQHAFDFGSATNERFDTNLLCINADQTRIFMEGPGAELTTGRRNIGVWAWEVDVLPERMRSAGELVDEAWGISQYTADCVAPWVECPVRAMPLPIELAPVSEQSRLELGLPSGFLVLSCFDLDSVFERKNPLAVLRTFRQAFPEPGEAQLVLKTINGSFHPQRVEELEEECGERPDIHFTDGYLPYEEQLAIMAHCDVYLTLHRAEGFGLTLGEAMALGKPVVATGFSANLEFMTGLNSRLVDYVPVRVGPHAAPYPRDAIWAEPCVADAAQKLRDLFDDQSGASALGRRAAVEIRAEHSAKARAPRLTRLLEAAWGRRSPTEGATTVGDGGALESLGYAGGLLERGPQTDLPSRLGALARMWRRTTFRMLQNYDLHQQAIVRALISSGAQASEESRALDAKVLEAARDLDGLTLRLSQLGNALEAERSARHGIAGRLEDRLVRSLRAHEERAAAVRKADVAAVATLRAEALARQAAEASAMQQVLERLSAIETRLERLESRSADVLGKFVVVDDELEHQRARTGDLERRLSAQAERHQEEQEAAQARIRELEETLLATTVRAQDLEDRHGGLQKSIQDLEAAVAARLAAMAAATPWGRAIEVAGRRIEEVGQAVTELRDEMFSAPYLAAPEELIVDRDGVPTLSWSSTEAAGAGDGYPAFEDVFRGTFEFIRERHESYLSDLAEQAPILDFGCGRGEMLDLLREAGIEATGVDQDADQVARCAALGLDVVCGDGLEHLEGLPDQSLGAIFSAQVVEHLDVGEIDRLLRTSLKKLRPDGLLVLETPNPHSPRALRAFWVDPTHRAPLFPETMLVLARDCGFGQIEVRFPFGQGNYETDRKTQGEYALFARKTTRKTTGMRKTKRS